MSEEFTQTVAATTLNGPQQTLSGESAAGLVSSGALIGRYVVLSKLGAGAMGVVLAAYDPELDRKVALKLLGAARSTGDSMHTRLQREAQALAKLNHHNVVAVHDVGVHEGQLFVGMEYVEGQTLHEWMTALDQPRPWPEVLRVFMEAGQGLAAAHEADLIHRDFKPDNVMLSGDGRVRVMDFGLARSSGEMVEQGEPENRVPLESTFEQILHSVGKQRLVDGLTQTGTMMGTPAYMPLEQFGAGQVDARSDQFSFCVALYEALYGERPFAGTTPGQLLLAIRDCEIREPPKRTKVPGWLRKVVVRGLAANKDARWPSIAALLDALADDPALRRRRWWATTLVAGLISAASFGIWYAVDQDAQVCADMAVRLEGVWDANRRDEVRAAIEATQLSYAPETWERVEAGLNVYTQEWLAARVDACEATHRGEQSGELLDLRMACLDERLSHVSATVEVLAAADETVVNRAVAAVAALPGLERCADVVALRAELPPPEDPEVARRAKALDDQLIEAKALQKVGNYEQGLAKADAAVREADALGYEPLQARAWLRQGQLQVDKGDYQAAEATLEQAYEAAVRLRMAGEAADASRELMYVVGYALARHEDGWQWAKHAKPLAEAAGTDEALAGYLNNRGLVALRGAMLAEAGADFERALLLREQSLGPNHPEVADSLNNLGIIAAEDGKLEEARAIYERVLSIREQALGPNHPEVAGALNNLGRVASMQGKPEEARANYERSLAIRERALGPDHPSVASSLNNLGALASAQGKFEDARGSHERALAIRDKALGPDHPSVAESLTELGRVALSEGKFEEAARYDERALAIFEQALGPDHPDLAETSTGLGEALLGQNRAAEALSPLERALSILTSNDVDPTALAETRFALARALSAAPADAGRDRERARILAELARDGYANAGVGSAKPLEHVQRWLAEQE